MIIHTCRARINLHCTSESRLIILFPIKKKNTETGVMLNIITNCAHSRLYADV